MADPDIDDLKRRMNGAIEVLRDEFGGLRTGRASPALLEPITVDAYGSPMPMNQVGTISAPDGRMLAVQVWDNSLISSVEKAIRDSNLGLNPQTEGNVVRVPVPQLSGRPAHRNDQDCRQVCRTGADCSAKRPPRWH